MTIAAHPSRLNGCRAGAVEDPMRRSISYRALAAASAVLLLGVSGFAPAPQDASAYAEVLASSDRLAADRARDEGRRAAETLAFAQVRAGQKIADMIIGGGYFTRIFSAAVGEEGSGHAWQPAEFIAFQASYGESLTAVDEPSRMSTAYARRSLRRSSRRAGSGLHGPELPRPSPRALRPGGHGLAGSTRLFCGAEAGRAVCRDRRPCTSWSSPLGVQ
jgi:hypothetical protein